jgi:molybdenum cofactor guanylyltransferase
MLPECGSGVDAVGFVLAGGLSTRMGEDKALTLLGGRPLVSYALEILRGSGLSASIAGARSSLESYAPVIADGGLGPLAGVCAALASASVPTAVFLSVDMPLLPASLITALFNDAQATGAVVTVPSGNGYAQTFPAILSRTMLPMLQKSLREGDRGCYAAFQAAAEQLHSPIRILPVELLAQAGKVIHPEGLPASFWFWNVNTPADLARAKGLLSAPDRVS